MNTLQYIYCMCAYIPQCSSECGNGTQDRGVVCVLQNNGQLEVTSDDRCSHLPRPPSAQICNLKSCSAQWYMTDWSSVSSPKHTNKETQIKFSLNETRLFCHSVLAHAMVAFEWGRYVVCKKTWPLARTATLFLNLQNKRSVIHRPAYHKLVWFSSLKFFTETDVNVSPISFFCPSCSFPYNES